MSNHLSNLSSRLRGLATEVARTEGPAMMDMPTDSERLRAAAVVIERQPCQHECDNLLIKGVRIGRCQHCQTPMKLAWIEDTAAEESSEVTL